MTERQSHDPGLVERVALAVRESIFRNTVYESEVAKRPLFLSDIANAIAALDAAEAWRREHLWQPIETAPKDGSWFIVYCTESPMAWQPFELSRWFEVAEGFANSPGYFCMTDVSDEFDFREYGATHWMPLPKPPESPHD